MSIDVREKIITAAMTAYAESGFQGATTRRVAEIAGVNEVTIFRNFGSKAALMDEALFRRVAELKIVDPPLPAVAADPLEELTAWCNQFLTQIRVARIAAEGDGRGRSALSRDEEQLRAGTLRRPRSA